MRSRQPTDGFTNGAERTAEIRRISAKRKLRLSRLRFVSQNCRGLKKVDGKLEELFSQLEEKDIFAACLQETWREGKEFLEGDGKGKLLLAGKRKQADWSWF